jgi:hypothetical protein
MNAKVAKGPRRFLSDQDQTLCSPENLPNEPMVVSIDPAAPPLTLIELALLRLEREYAMLENLACLPLEAEVQVATMANWLIAPLAEIRNLLSAASDAMGAKKGGAA